MIKKIISNLIIISFLLLEIFPYENVFAQDDLILPPAGQILPLSPEFTPIMIKGLKLHKDNPFEFDFIINQGQDNLPEGQFKEESLKLVKYFLASLTIPEKDLWVNLSPYEKNRITTAELGVTDMGIDLLSQDYVLKQLTSSLIYPEGQTGKRFWSKVYALAEEKYHTTNVPINTFNKVWIVPQKAVVYENYDNQTAYVLESKLKVMLEEDYLALQKHSSNPSSSFPNISVGNPDTNQLGSQIVREIVIPELTKEVNYGKNFANLRQITNSLILAAWFKRALKASILAKLYVDQKKIKGVDLDDKTVTERIFQQYLRAYKKGAYNYIKEEADPVSGEIIPRKYFSGGFFGEINDFEVKNYATPAQVREKNDRAVTVDFNNAMASAELSPERKKEIISSAFFPLGDAMLRILRIFPTKPLTPIQKKKFVEAAIPAVKQAYLNNEKEINEAEDFLPRPQAPAMYQRNEVFRYSGPEGVVVALDHIFKKGTRLHGHSPLGRVTVSSFGEFPDAVKIYEFLKNNGLLEVVPESERVSDEEEGIPYQLNSKDKFALSLFIGPDNNKYRRILKIIRNAHEEASSGVIIIPRADGYTEEKYPDHIYQGQKELNLDPNTLVTMPPLKKDNVYGFTDYEYGVHKVLYNPGYTGPEYAGMIEVYYFPKPAQGFNSFFPVLGSKDNQYKSIPRFRAERMVYPNFIDIANHEHWQEISKKHARRILSDTRSQHYFIRVINGEDYFVPESEVQKQLEGAVRLRVAITDTRFVEIEDAAMTSIAAPSENDKNEPYEIIATKEQYRDPENRDKMADGIIRTEFYQYSPEELREIQIQKWGEEIDGIPVSDVIIKGGGPFGLSIAAHLAAAGLKVGVYEAGTVANSFSDAKQDNPGLRTPAFRISAVQPGYSPDILLKALYMPYFLSRYRYLATEAREFITRITGKKFVGIVAGTDDWKKPKANIPVTRAEYYEHLLDVVRYINRNKLATIDENDGIDKEELGSKELTLITTAKGHQQYGRYLIDTTGFVGQFAQYEKIPDIVNNILDRNPDLFLRIFNLEDANKLTSAEQFKGKFPLITASNFNHPYIRAFLLSLPQGASVAVDGGGLSAGNIIVGIHNIRPDINVYVFINEEFRKHASQMQGGNRTPSFIHQIYEEPQLREVALKVWREHGKPITPPVYDYIRSRKQQKPSVEHQGAIYIIPGAYFDAKNYELEPFKKEDKVWVLILRKYPDGPKVVAEINGGIVSAIGWDTEKLHKDIEKRYGPGFVRLNEGKIELLADGITSAANPHLFFAGPVVQEAPIYSSAHNAPILARKITNIILGKKEPKLTEQELINKFKKEYEAIDYVQSPLARHYLLLSAQQPGKTPEEIRSLYEKAYDFKPSEEIAAKLVWDGVQPGFDLDRVISEYKDNVLPEALERVAIIDRINAVNQPGQSTASIGALFGEINQITQSPFATEQLLYPATQLGVGLQKTIRLFNEFHKSYPADIAASLVRSTIAYFPQTTVNAHKDPALIAVHSIQKHLDPGGIDLAMTNADFEIKRDAHGIPLPVQFQDLENIHINGLRPVIIKDMPIINLSVFLGVSAS